MMDEVILNIYELPMTPSNGGADRQSTSSSSAVSPPMCWGVSMSSITSCFSKMLPTVGFGAYHTDLNVDGHCYSYAIGGVSKIPSCKTHKCLPNGATFKESIVLGTVNTNNKNNTDSNSSTSTTIVQNCLKNLQQHYFTPTGYHLANRNCNHFTETFALALVLSCEELLQHAILKTYPKYINRLARTGSAVLDKNSDKAAATTTSVQNGNTHNINDSLLPSSYCEVIKEARFAVGIDVGDEQKMAKHLASLLDNNKRRKQKKELTNKQKSMLAKLKTKG